jgi:drug/metabolite transporter (DMT)-like permease
MVGSLEIEPLPTSNKQPRRWTIIASGLLIAALAVVVLYTSRGAFSSPIAVLVVAAIGLAAVLLQVRLQRDLRGAVRSPLWLNLFGIIFALGALFGDAFHMSPRSAEFSALGAIGCFGVSGAIVLDAMRRYRAASGR